MMRTVTTTDSTTIYSHGPAAATLSLDLTALDNSQDTVAQPILDQLLKGLVQMDLRPSGLAADHLLELYLQAKSLENNEGIRCFGLAFPLLAMPGAQTETILRPILIWQLQLEANPTKTDQWRLQSPNGYRLQLNPLVREALLTWLPETTIHTLDQTLQSGTYTQKNLWQFVDQLLENAVPEPLSKDLQPIPTQAQLAEWSPTPFVLPAAFLATFPVLLHDQPPLKMAENDPNLQPTTEHPFGFFHLQPAAAAIFESTQRQRLTLVTDQPATTYQPALFQLLSHALSNGQKVLITSDRIGNLAQLQKELTNYQLDAYHYFLRESSADLPVIADLMKAKANNPIKNNSSFPTNQYNLLLGKCLRNKQKLDAAFSSLRQPLFGQLNWTELVGFFLKSNTIEGKELLDTQLHASDFEFHYEEFSTLKTALEISQPLYRKVNTLKHPLTQLHPSLFIEKEQPEGHDWVEKTLTWAIQEAKKLQHRYISCLDSYSLRLSDHYHKYYTQFTSRLNHSLDFMTDASNQFGTKFMEANRSTLRMQGLFSAPARLLREAQEKAAANYHNLAELFEKIPLFEFDFPRNLNERNLPAIRKTLEDFQLQLLRWRDGLEQVVQEESIRLNANNVHPELKFQGIIEDLDQQLQNYLHELNEKLLFRQPIQHQMLTVPQKQKFLEQTIELFEHTQLNLRDFDVFYPWQRNWLQLSDKGQKVLKALIKVKPNNWFVAFDSWYFHQYLHKHYQEQLPTDLEVLQQFVADLEAFRQLLPQKALLVRNEQQQHAAKLLKRLDKNCHQLFFGKQSPEGNRKNIRLAFDQGQACIAAFFPLLLAPAPLILQDVQPQEVPTFDYLILLEANGMPPDALQQLQQLAKHTLVISQSYPKAPNPLPASLGKKGLTPLDIPSSLHQLLPPLCADQYELVEVSGSYQENTQQNDLEAQTVLQILNNIRETPHRTYPSVGILTLTEGQRNLIATYLLRIKQQKASGHEKIRQLERNGMRVLQLEEAEGQHFDILIGSYTFGTKDGQGNFTEHYLEMEPRQLRPWFGWLLLQRPKQVYLLHSLPAKHLSLETDKVTAWDFFLYVQAQQQGDAATISKIFKKYFPENEADQPEQYFAKEIARHLSGYFDKDRLQVGIHWQDLFLPLLLKPNAAEDPTLLVQTDLFFANTPYTDYSWEFQIREDLAEREVSILDIWSTHWWKNPNEESRRLASRILQLLQRQVRLDDGAS